ISPKSVVFNNDELKERIDYYLKNYNQPALVEVFIDGREFHVSVLGNEIIEVLPIAEMDYSKFEDIHDRLCTYESKFVPGSKHYSGIETLLPAPLTNDEFRKIIEVSKLSFKILGCRDYARIDIRMLDNKIYVLDVNPNPDISADASMACAAEFLGMDYSDFIEKLVNITIDRYSAASAKLKK
ncbi:MAG TPA: ATP-grasp domain-containing protein, partial [bacterium]|nr:ATP-grasp domain-containing protein [bacterium]